MMRQHITPNLSADIFLNTKYYNSSEQEIFHSVGQYSFVVTDIRTPAYPVLC
jgi:hypothetical protein